MKILVISHFQGGDSPTTCYIHDQALAYRALGHEVRVIAPLRILKTDYYGKRFSGKILQKTVIDGIPHCFFWYLSAYRRGIGGFNAKSAVATLSLVWKRILDGYRPDVIHVHTMGVDSEIGAWLKEKLHCPLVVTTHGSDAIYPLQHGREDLVRRWCDKADAMVCVGSRLRQMLLDAGVKTPLHLILNGFNLQYLPEEVQKQPGSIIQVGNLIPRKKADVTIRALKLIREKCPYATLTLVGDGPERERLETLAAELGIREAVSFTGHISNREVLERVASAEYFVMVSVNEGFGIVYLEAMAAGCLTIGTRNEGIADVITSGENGYLLPPDDPGAIAETILRAIENPEEGRRIAQCGREMALGYSWKVNAEKNLQLFRSLI